MDFDLSGDQEALREAAGALLNRHANHEALRARVGEGAIVGTLPGAKAEATSEAPDAAPHGFDRIAWSHMAEQGWLALEVPEDEGGLGLGMVEVAVLCEQLGQRLVAVPYLSSVLALGALRHPDAPVNEQTTSWSTALADGSAIGCVAFASGTDSLSMAGEGAHVVLNGQVGPVVFAPSADVAIIVTTDAVLAIDVTDHDRPVPLSAMDRTRELGNFEFRETPAVRIGGADAAALVLDRAATGCSAEMLGAADRVLAMTVEYAKDRVQFGKPIGSFQAIKHMLADALVDVEGMRSTVYYAAWCAAADDHERSLAASMAKAWCSDASRRVMGAGLQAHGGIGFTWEHDMHLFVKRAQLDQVSFGDAAYHRDRIAGLLQDRLAAGQSIA